jgi:dTDP-4-amino-4,6-dideoxygalactose transaminase
LIPFFDLRQVPLSLKREWHLAATRVIESGRFIGGPEVSDFETNWAGYLGIEYAVGVANGLDAITLSLKALDIGPGAKVAVPSHTFLATWLSVEAVGATPIGIDCDRKGMMDLQVLESHPESFQAVIPVHMHGQMVDMPRLSKWASEKNVKVIEDCAQAHGAKIHGRFAGTWGDIGAFSFYPTKNLGALGDAGIVVTGDAALAKIVRSLGNYGSVPESKYKYARIGFNSRLDPIQAAILGVNLKYLDTWNARRREVARKLISALSAKGISLLVDDADESVWHHFIVLPRDRDKAKIALEEKGILTEIHYPESAATSYRSITGVSSTDSPNAQELATRTLSLPISPWITEDQIQFVIDAFNDRRLLRYFLGDK